MDFLCAAPCRGSMPQKWCMERKKISSFAARTPRVWTRSSGGKVGSILVNSSARDFALAAKSVK